MPPPRGHPGPGSKRMLDRIYKIHGIARNEFISSQNTNSAISDVPTSGFCQWIPLAHPSSKPCLSFFASLQFCPKSTRPHFLKNRPPAACPTPLLSQPSFPIKTRLTPFWSPVFLDRFSKNPCFSPISSRAFHVEQFLAF